MELKSHAGKYAGPHWRQPGGIVLTRLIYEVPSTGSLLHPLTVLKRAGIQSPESEEGRHEYSEIIDPGSWLLSVDSGHLYSDSARLRWKIIFLAEHWGKWRCRRTT